MGITAGAGLAIGGVASGALGAGASLIASGRQASAADKAAALQQQMFQTIQGNQAPFVSAGQNMLQPLQTLATSGPTGGGPDYVAQAAGMQPGQMTEAELQQTPGYQFILDQGLKSTQSSNAARGLGVSGAAMKGAASYATGLADQTYQTQFNMAQTRFQNALNLNTAQQGNLTNQFNRLSGVAGLGENAAAQTGQQGTNLASAQGQYLTAAGTAQGTGIMNASNAITGTANNLLGYYALQNMLPNAGGGGTGGYGAGAGNTPPGYAPGSYGAFGPTSMT